MNPAAQISRTTGAKARARKLAATIWDRAPGARPRPRGTPLASPRSLFAAKSVSISEPDNEQQRGLKSNAVSLDQIRRLFVGGFAPIRHTTFLQAAMGDGRTATQAAEEHSDVAVGFALALWLYVAFMFYVIPALIAWDRRYPAAGIIWAFTLAGLDWRWRRLRMVGRQRTARSPRKRADWPSTNPRIVESVTNRHVWHRAFD